ncbi:hypothetical protein GCM10009551_049860 [Nocardiopsis tropica]
MSKNKPTRTAPSLRDRRPARPCRNSTERPRSGSGAVTGMTGCGQGAGEGAPGRGAGGGPSGGGPSRARRAVADSAVIPAVPGSKAW